MADMTESRTAAAAEQPAPLVVSRVLHAPRETVFRAWGSADSVKRWFAPPPLTVPEARIEMRKGGAFEVCMQMPEGARHWTRGIFLEVDASRRLVIDMRVSGDDGKRLFRAMTEIVFSDALAGTRLDVTQSYTFDDPKIAAGMVAGAGEGWRRTLDNLEQEVIRMQGGAETEARSVVHAIFSLERAYDAPAARIWRALTDESAKARWFTGTAGEWELIERTMDVRPGGRERLEGRWKSGVVSAFDAHYLDVIPQERLIYAYEMRLDGRKISASLATMQIKAEGRRTRLKVTEQGAFLDGYDDAGSREHGTGVLLDALGASLSD